MKIQITENTWKDFQLPEGVISPASSQIHFDSKILLTLTWKLIWKLTFNLGLVKLIHLEYNKNFTQNQNEFQVSVWNLLDNSSVNIKFSNKSIL